MIEIDAVIRPIDALREVHEDEELSSLHLLQAYLSALAHHVDICSIVQNMLASNIRAIVVMSLSQWGTKSETGHEKKINNRYVGKTMEHKTYFSAFSRYRCRSPIMILASRLPSRT